MAKSAFDEQSANVGRAGSDGPDDFGFSNLYSGVSHYSGHKVSGVEKHLGLMADADGDYDGDPELRGPGVGARGEGIPAND